MKILNGLPNYELTFNDAFLIPSLSDIDSRFEVDIAPLDGTGANAPIVVSNMNAVAGKRMCETIARRGGLTVLPQDIPVKTLRETINYIKSRHVVYETPLTLTPDNTIAEALNIIHKRSHGLVIVVDSKNRPVGVFQESDSIGMDRFTPLSEVMTKEVVTIEAGQTNKRMFELLYKKRVSAAPVVKNGQIVGIVTQKGALRSDIYKPAVDKNGKLLVAVAVGINGDIEAKAKTILSMGADILVLDTAHGHQKKMIEAIKKVRKIAKNVPLVAGNVVTADATRDLVNAGADIIKVGVGPGAMCTTRMMTGVGRPQLSAILECAPIARELGAHIWADGGVRYPRDVALALAAGASNVMWGSMWAGTHESAGDTLKDNDGRLYKENYGMASNRAVKARSRNDSIFSQMHKEFFEEGISSSKLYIDPARPGAEDIIDYITAGLRSSMTYAGARNLKEFQEKAVMGIQSASGFTEGTALAASWQ